MPGIIRKLPFFGRFTDNFPRLLECQGGIVVIPDTADAGEPRLPILGLRAFRTNGLHISIDGRHQSVAIRAGRHFWPFG